MAESPRRQPVQHAAELLPNPHGQRPRCNRESTPLFYVAVTLILAGMAGMREPVQLLTALITIVSGSVVFYAFGLHKAAPAPAPAEGP
jgi:hypothetical protein